MNIRLSQFKEKKIVFFKIWNIWRQNIIIILYVMCIFKLLNIHSITFSTVYYFFTIKSLNLMWGSPIKLRKRTLCNLFAIQFFFYFTWNSIHRKNITSNSMRMEVDQTQRHDCSEKISFSHTFQGLNTLNTQNCGFFILDPEHLHFFRGSNQFLNWATLFCL